MLTSDTKRRIDACRDILVGKSDYKEGDTITVLALNLPFPQGKESHRSLAFSVLPKTK